MYDVGAVGVILLMTSFNFFTTLKSSLDFTARGQLEMSLQSNVLYSKLSSWVLKRSSCIRLVS